jgi:nucleoside-diphosphate kinase
MKTLILIKPDGVRRALIGEIINRFERVGFKIIAMKIVQIDRKTAEQLYEVHKGKEFFESLIGYITSGPIVPIALKIDSLSDDEGIKLARKIVGKTNPLEAEMGSIRGDFAISISENVIHASDSIENAMREMKIFFTEDELIK